MPTASVPVTATPGLHYTVFSPYSETGFEEIRVPQNQIYGQNPVRAVYGEAFMEQVTETVMIPGLGTPAVFDSRTGDSGRSGG